MRCNRMVTLVLAVCAVLGVGHSALAGSRIETEIPLVRSADAPTSAAGKIRYRERSGRRDVRAEIEDVPVGDYQLFVGGQLRATVAVVAVPGGTEGEAEFRDPVEPGKILLDFDPRGQSIAWRFNGVTVLSNDFPAPGSGGSPGNAGSDDSSFASQKSQGIFSPSGNDTGARGSLMIKSKKSKADLRIDLSGLDRNKTYTMIVDGMELVTFTPKKSGKAKLQFSTSANGKKLPLDFDPAQATFELLDDSGAVLEATANATPIGGGIDAPQRQKLPMASSGADSDGHAEAEIRARGARLDFQVEAEDVATGDYEVRVDGAVVALLTVTNRTQGSTQGEVEFSTDLSEADKLPLDFALDGALVEIVRDSVVYFSVVLPE
ncbi:MAG: hypothetical protein KDA20_11985 [Phycisphaerales bacterium]|nr:hypothetical protein [Phycisphaerales bacterium]